MHMLGYLLALYLRGNGTIWICPLPGKFDDFRIQVVAGYVSLREQFGLHLHSVQRWWSPPLGTGLDRRILRPLVNMSPFLVTVKA
ncbi:hypothetical protein EDC04DRAFT_2710256 [Pisolithus marmoratus]|nr:hypothetical protein EDC04DRAFT_2710256 [Pisolithus marmoratus]